MFLTGPTDNASSGTKRVIIRGADITGLEIRLTPLASLAGTVALAPIKPEDKCDKRGSQVGETVLSLPHDEPRSERKQTIAQMFGGGLGMFNEKGAFVLRNLEAGRYRLDFKLPTTSWYLQAITGAPRQPTAAQSKPEPQTAAPATRPAPNDWTGVLAIKPGEQINGISITVGQDAAGLRGRPTMAGAGAALPAGTRVHLVPADRAQTNDVLRYYETLVKSDGSFTLTNLAPGRYFILSRSEAAGEVDLPLRPAAWDPVSRATLRRQAEAANVAIALQPCQRIVDYDLKPGG